MKTELKILPKSEVQLTVELTAEELATYETEATKRISQNVEISGFRKGQAPKAFVLAQVGAEAFFRDLLNVALPRSYFEAIKEHKLQVISRPDVKVVSRSPFKYEARIAVLPQITFKDYEKIKVPKEKLTVTDAEIEEVVEEMRKYRAKYKPAERAVKKGDRVEIDFQGFDDGGATLENTKSSSHPLFVGEGSLIPGFEEELVGMKIGDKKKFPLKFPADYHHEPFKGKSVHFEVTMKRADEAILPELTQEFVEQVMGDKKTIAEFKDSLRGDFMKKKDVESRRNRENKLLEKFLKEAKMDVPPVLVEEEVDYMIHDLEREIGNRGLKFETYLEKLKKEGKDLKKEYTPEAEKRVKIRLLLNFLFKEIQIKVEDTEMQAACKKVLERAPVAEKDSVQKQIDSKGELFNRLHNNLMLEKLFAKFLD